MMAPCGLSHSACQLQALEVVAARSICCLSPTGSTLSGPRGAANKGSVMADKNRKSQAPQKQDDVIVPQDDATAHLVQTLVANGQAARANPDGSFPPGRTHELVGRTQTGLPIVPPRRVALY